MSHPDPGPPVPGDPRSSGPRPAPRARDLAWLTLAVALIVVTAAQLLRLAHRAATDPDVVAGGGALVLAFVVTVVWLLTVYWLAAGSWRRTIWGCPFEHTTSAPRARRCHRHDLLDDDHASDAPDPPPHDGERR